MKSNEIIWEVEEVIQSDEHVYRVVGFDLNGNEYEGSAIVHYGIVQEVLEMERTTPKSIRRWVDFCFSGENAEFLVKVVISESAIGFDFKTYEEHELKCQGSLSNVKELEVAAVVAFQKHLKRKDLQ